MGARIPFAELSFSWKLTIKADTLSDPTGDRIEIEQIIEFNQEQEGSRVMIPGEQIDHALLNRRFEYLAAHLRDKLARALASLNCEAIAFTDFIAKAAQGIELPRQIDTAFLRSLADRARNQSESAIEEDGKEQVREAKARFEQARLEYMNKRFPVINAICGQIKLAHDLQKLEFDQTKGRRPSGQEEWKKVWLQHAPREHEIPGDLLVKFAEGCAPSFIAALIVGLELGYETSTVQSYRKPSKRRRAKEEREINELKAAIAPHVYGAPSRKVTIQREREKRASKNPGKTEKKVR